MDWITQWLGALKAEERLITGSDNTPCQRASLPYDFEQGEVGALDGAALHKVLGIIQTLRADHPSEYWLKEQRDRVAQRLVTVLEPTTLTLQEWCSFVNGLSADDSSTIEIDQVIGAARQRIEPSAWTATLEAMGKGSFALKCWRRSKDLGLSEQDTAQLRAQVGCADLDCINAGKILDQALSAEDYFESAKDYLSAGSDPVIRARAVTVNLFLRGGGRYKELGLNPRHCVALFTQLDQDRFEGFAATFFQLARQSMGYEASLQCLKSASPQALKALEPILDLLRFHAPAPSLLRPDVHRKPGKGKKALLALKEGSLDERLLEHGQRRVVFFYYLLLMVYGDGLEYTQHTTFLQYGQGEKGEHAAHSTILPNIVRAMGSKEVPVSENRSLVDLYLFNALNATVALPSKVNLGVDKALESAVRPDANRILNMVSKGKLNPEEGLWMWIGCLQRAYQELRPRYSEPIALYRQGLDGFGDPFFWGIAQLELTPSQKQKLLPQGATCWRGLTRNQQEAIYAAFRENIFAHKMTDSLFNWW
ncbi:MAG: hypothetical protein AB7F31_02995 [Parachlamydiales bacterium]